MTDQNMQLKPKKLSGVIAVNKPKGMTSNDVVQRIKYRLNKYKKYSPVHKTRYLRVGHAGTLDPLASGLLVIGINNGTKKMHEFLADFKTYEVTVLFGSSTTTYDGEGAVCSVNRTDHITRETLMEAIQKVSGRNILQMPPIYSALKMIGRPLYDYARKFDDLPSPIIARTQKADIELLEFTRDHTYTNPETQVSLDEYLYLERNAKSQYLDPAHSWPGLDSETNKQDPPKATESVSNNTQENGKKSKKARKKSDDNGSIKTTNGPQMSHQMKAEKERQLKEALKPKEDKLGQPIARLRLQVDAGYYVRSFCHDLGRVLGSSAHMVELCRTRQGTFSLENSAQLLRLDNADIDFKDPDFQFDLEIEKYMIPVDPYTEGFLKHKDTILLNLHKESLIAGSALVEPAPSRVFQRRASWPKALVDEVSKDQKRKADDLDMETESQPKIYYLGHRRHMKRHKRFEKGYLTESDVDDSSYIVSSTPKEEFHFFDLGKKPKQKKVEGPKFR